MDTAPTMYSMYAVPILLEKIRFVCVRAGGLTASHPGVVMVHGATKIQIQKTRKRKTKYKKSDYLKLRTSPSVLDVALYRIILNVPCQEEHDLNFSFFFV